MVIDASAIIWLDTERWLVFCCGRSVIERMILMPAFLTLKSGDSPFMQHPIEHRSIGSLLFKKGTKIA